MKGLYRTFLSEDGRKGLAEAGVIIDKDVEHNAGGDTLDLRAVESEIRSIRGIGEKRTEEIMLIFEKHLGIVDEDMNHK